MPDKQGHKNKTLTLLCLHGDWEGLAVQSSLLHTCFSNIQTFEGLTRQNGESELFWVEPKTLHFYAGV